MVIFLDSSFQGAVREAKGDNSVTEGLPFSLEV